MKNMATKTGPIRQIASLAIVLSILFTNAFAVGAVRNDTINVVASTTAMAKYTTDLTQLGREGRLRENLSYETETIQLLKVLAEGGLRQPVVVNEDPEIQNMIVEQAALRIAKGSAPEGLAGKSIIKVDTANLFSNSNTAADAGKVIDSIVSEAIASKGRVILYVDEMSNFVGAKSATEEFFTAIRDGKIAIIGSSSAVAYNESIEANAEVAGYFTGILVAGASAAVAQNDNDNSKSSEYRGDNVSPDLRDMMAEDPSGKKRVDVILQAKDADNSALRSLLASGQAHVTERIGNTDTLVVNLPLSVLSTLSTSGLMNYVSPDRPTTMTGHVEDTTGTTLMRAQAALNGRAATTLMVPVSALLSLTRVSIRLTRDSRRTETTRIPAGSRQA